MENNQSSNPLIRKLERFIPLGAEDLRAVEQLGGRREYFDADQDIIAQGAVPRSVFLLLDGMACRYRLLADGKRQIITFLLPGDLCDLHVFLLRKMDHSIGTLTPVKIASIAKEDVLDMSVRHPRISIGLWWSTMQEEAMLRERIVALGRRDANARVAYLLCELVWRKKAIGETKVNSIDLPLTQIELADTLGLTPVHVNRVLQDMRRKQLLVLEQRKLILLDIDRLARLAEFNEEYLHLGPAPSEVQRYFG